MTNEYGFFTGKNGDRKYTADDFCAFFSDFFTDGILAGNMNSFRVSAQGGMKLKINDGTAYVKGRWYRKNDCQYLDIPVSPTEYDRCDAVVIRCDFIQRSIYVTLIEGTPSTEPERPLPLRNDKVYDLVTAYIDVKSDSFEITDADITDCRFDGSLCGIVTNVIKSIDTSELFAQFQAAWNNFVAQLGESDNVTISTEDTESRKQVRQIREQTPFGSMFMMV